MNGFKTALLAGVALVTMGGAAFASSSTITQAGQNLSAGVDQSGGNQTSSVNQSGDYQNASVTQAGAGNGSSTIIQTNGDASGPASNRQNATVRQYNFGMNDNTASITQNGTVRNNATIDQGTSGSPIRGATATITQNSGSGGFDNTAAINQSAGLNNAELRQTGNNLQAFIVQSSFPNNDARLEQQPLSTAFSTYNYASITQSGDNNKVQNTSAGGANALGDKNNPVSSYAQQGGAGNTMIVQQTGSGGIAGIYQDGGTTSAYNSNNYLNLNQGGTGNFANMAQIGTLITANTTQSGTGNSSQSDQQGDNLTVNVQQSVGNNLSLITQRGAFQTANVTQSTGGNSSNVNQSGNGPNTANVNQH